MKVTVDKDLCTGCGLCVDECPDVFEMDEDAGVAVVKSGDVPVDLEDSARDAAEGCPVEAILVQ